MLASATTQTEDILGEFVERDHKHTFNYIASTNDWGIKHGLPHEVFCGPDGTTRPALVKGTVCYMSVDEGPDGKPVLEKWFIRHCWKR